MGIQPAGLSARQGQARAVPYAGLAQVYDALLGDRFFARARGNFERLRRRYGLRPRSAADVACGTGSFVRYLQQQGVGRVYGVDRSGDMLRIAALKNRGNGARFLQQDFHSLRLPERVELISCNFDSLNYLLSEGDLLRALERFQANLAPGGRLIFDMITPHQPWGSERPLVEQRTWPGGGFWRRMRLDPVSGLQESRVRVRLGGRDYQERHVQRAYPWPVVERCLRRAGFVDLRVEDFYTHRAIDGRTRRILATACKGDHRRGESGSKPHRFSKPVRF